MSKRFKMINLGVKEVIIIFGDLGQTGVFVQKLMF
jgi:hypothetical protein